MFDEYVSYLLECKSIPDKITNKFEDYKKYDISREGITSRYQILVLPNLEDANFNS